jgi:PadR family transcriptional regulator AphA
MIYRYDVSGTTIRVAILGMLTFRPMTGYEIKQVYQRGPANFMPISFGQIYPVLASLRQEKMVRPETKQGGRGKIRYFITSKGDEAFQNWLLSTGDSTNHRELLLRLFFAAPSALPQLRGHVEAYRREEQAALDRYDETRKWLDQVHGRDPRLATWKLVMEYGVLESQYRIRWAEQALAFVTNRKKETQIK